MHLPCGFQVHRTLGYHFYTDDRVELCARMNRFVGAVSSLRIEPARVMASDVLSNARRLVGPLMEAVYHVEIEREVASHR
jgi:hypothetical protein